MADTVQHLLEESIPELEYYQAKGYFSKFELKQIIMSRQNHEYRLKRRAAMKQDYYRYIEYEQKLEELRQYRKQKLGFKGKKSSHEVTIVKRVHFIFERAARKFKSDVQLWMDWLEYCRRSKSSKQHSKVVTRALQRHATVPALWIEAACWEFEHSGNVAAARSLMQQGLRMCKHEEVMWVEYLRLELMYIQRLRERRRVLGLDVPEEEAAGGSNKSSAKVAEITDEAMDVEGRDVDAEASASPDSDDGAEAAVRAVLMGAVAGIVLKNALVTFPTSLDLRRQLLRVLTGFDFPGIQVLLDTLFMSLRSDFANQEEAWDILARRSQTNSRGQEADLLEASAHGPAVQSYQEAVAVVRTSKMYDLYTRYLESRLELYMHRIEDLGSSRDGDLAVVGVDEPDGKSAPKQDLDNNGLKRRKEIPTAAEAARGASSAAVMDSIAKAGAELLAAYQSAHSTHCCSPELYLRWTATAEKLGQQKMAAAALRQGCLRHPASVTLWSQRLRREVEAVLQQRGGLAQREETASTLLTTFKSALASVQDSDCYELWTLVLDIIPLQGREFKAMVDLLLVAVMKVSISGPLHGGLGGVIAALMKRIRMSSGLEESRSFYRKFLHLPSPGGDFYQAAVDIELEARRGIVLQKNVQKERDLVTPLFEAAVAAHGRDDPELWIRFAKYEAECGRSAGTIYWRATKALVDPDRFITLYKEHL
ncbi:hypothetical protein CEUSTIGMA_g9727.t1 [Chlamydomonas eustigma]|uniref:U3 small nucleolar RNA-associated protein 6 homolog n=1 Tax=Chlamydomonas eustigma TaxID=1157962 RepID=A0A250XGU8_9CHLO|nr:hypothetical protein CEUSTIGMA_g9727.t1 [Chlamydomonas eustigma]|eukprot:GAX82298.1 hypothetical protein CEUSTIGMA_g9727.t1 [Chlamydomonas eustigma]